MKIAAVSCAWADGDDAPTRASALATAFGPLACFPTIHCVSRLSRYSPSSPLLVFMGVGVSVGREGGLQLSCPSAVACFLFVLYGWAWHRCCLEAVRQPRTPVYLQLQHHAPRVAGRRMPLSDVAPSCVCIPANDY